MERTPQRPPPDTLAVRCYDFAVTPLDAALARTVKLGNSTVQIALTPSGHALHWQTGAVSLCEIVGSVAELPAGFRTDKPVAGTHAAKFRTKGWTYRVAIQTEIVEDDVFLHLHDELIADGAKGGLFAEFAPRHRFGLPPLSWVSAELLPSGLQSNAFHTFPDFRAILKAQTLIEAVA
jgi:hypothetical protein